MNPFLSLEELSRREQRRQRQIDRAVVWAAAFISSACVAFVTKGWLW